MTKNDDIDTYLASLSPPFRGALEKLRTIIRSAAPGAEEGFHYGVPAFKMKGKPLACYAAFKTHCGFYPLSPSVISQFQRELAEFETAKGDSQVYTGKANTRLPGKKNGEGANCRDYPMNIISRGGKE